MVMKTRRITLSTVAAIDTPLDTLAEFREHVLTLPAWEAGGST
jgi:hypothetical protein